MNRAPLAIWRVIAPAILLSCLSSPGYPAAPPAGKPVPGQEGRRNAGAAAAVRPAAPSSEGPKLVTGPGGDKMVAMQFFGTDVDHVLMLLSKAAGVTIIKSDQVSGPLTIIAPEPVPLDEAFQLLNEVLAVRGFTMVRSPSGTYKVVPRTEAMRLPLPLQSGADPEQVPTGDDLITQVIPLTNLSANDAVTQVREMLSENARVIPTATNSLIVTDSAGGIQQALRVIADMENELSGGLRVFQLYYHDAEEMAQLVDAFILSRGAAGGPQPRRPWERAVVRAGRPRVAQPTAQPAVGQLVQGEGPEFCYPDTRTNSLVVLATPLHQQQIEDLVSQLDRQVSLRDSCFVYPVQNVMASELAQIVGALVDAEVRDETPGSARGAAAGGAAAGGIFQPPPGWGQFGRAASGSRVGARGAQTLEDPADYREPRGLQVEPLAGAAEGGVAVGIPAPAPGAGAAVEVAPQPEFPGGEPPTFPGVEDVAQVTSTAQALIVADDNSNTLLISAPAEQLDLIQQMIEKLDVLPPQVHIRAIIAEVLLTRTTSLGFQWESLGRTFATLQDGSRLNVFDGDVGTDFGLGAGAEGGQGAGLFGTISGPEFDAVLSALTTDSHVRILASPSIFTANNVAAKIDVSKNIPFPRSTTEYLTGEGATRTQVEYESVGIIVDVTPRVTQGNMVRLEITVSSDELGDSISVAGEEYPTTNKRSANATLHIKDGYTAVLGGLMRDTISRTASRVPILGDIPLVGSLFRSTTSRREKSELLVFLTPHVVRTPAESARVSEQEKSRLPEVPRSLSEPADGAAISEPAAEESQ